MRKIIYYYFYCFSRLKVYIGFFAWIFIFADILLFALPIPKQLESIVPLYLLLYLFFPWSISLFAAFKLCQKFRPLPAKFSIRTWLIILGLVTLFFAPIILVNLVIVLDVKFGWKV